MNRKNTRSILRTLLFLGGGMVAGYLYYRTIGCASGTCAITSNGPYATIYGGLVGLLLSLAFAPSKNSTN